MPNSKNNNNKSNSENFLTIKEVSTKLDISEATVRKYLKEFDLDFEKASSTKAVISEATHQALSEIAKLRANGLSIQEIKELKSQEPSKHILDEVEVGDKLKEEVKVKEDSSVLLDGIEAKDELSIEEADLEDLQIEPGEGEEDEEEEEQLLEEVQEGTSRRRQLFNYRYVERQISNDSKRVRSLRLRLKNTNLMVHERLFIEEALERRILFLEGWKHILRWLSTK